MFPQNFNYTNNLFEDFDRMDGIGSKVSNADINSFVQANIGNPQAIADAAKQYGVSPERLSQATGYDAGTVNNYFGNAGIDMWGQPAAQATTPAAAPPAPPASTGMTVNDLYTQILGRAPDAGGLAYWQNAFGSGPVTAEQQASFMQAAQGELANRSAAEQQQLAPNLAAQTPVAQQGTTGTVAQPIANPSAVQQNIIMQEQQRNAGLPSLTSQTQQNTTPPPSQIPVDKNFINSMVEAPIPMDGMGQTVQQKPTTVEDLYRTILGREGEQSGLDFWKKSFGDTIDANEIASFKQAAQKELANRTPEEQRQLAPTLVAENAVAKAGLTPSQLLYYNQLASNPNSNPEENLAYVKGLSDYQALSSASAGNLTPAQKAIFSGTNGAATMDMLAQKYGIAGPITVGQGKTYTPKSATGQAITSQAQAAASQAPGVTVPNDANSKTVSDLYASIGRSGIGTATNQIDQGGFDYWKQKLDSGMTPEQVKAEFKSTVNDFLTNKQADPYSQYVAPTYLKTVAADAFSDANLNPWEKINKVMETAQTYGLDDKKLDSIFGKDVVDKYRADYGAGIKDFINKTLAKNEGTTFDEVAAIKNEARKYGLDPTEVAKYTGMNQTGVNTLFDAYDKGLANIAKGWETAKTTAGKDAAALSTAEADKAKTMLALQSQYNVTDEDLAKATGTTAKDVNSYLTTVKETPKTIESLMGDTKLTGSDIKAKIAEIRSNPAVNGIYGAALDKLAASADKQYAGDYNGKQYDFNPLAVDNVLNQLKAQQNAGTAQYYQGGAKGSKDQGFGSLDKVTEDMAKNLVAAGITDLRQVGQVPKYDPVEVIGQKYNGQTVQKAYTSDGEVEYSYIKKPNGKIDEDGNQGYDIVKVPGNAKLENVYGTQDSEGNAIPVDAAKVTTDKNGKPVMQTGTVAGNKLTGEPLSKASNYGERTTGNSWSGTYKGDGNTGYNVQFDKNGNPIFYTTGASSSDMQNVAPFLAMASLIPGAAPFVAAINAAYAAHEGNWKQALLSALPAVGEIANMAGASANTVANIGTASRAANLANAVANKNLLGTVMGGVGLASDANLMGENAFNPSAKVVGDFSTKDILGGVSLANALKNGDLTTLANVGAQMSGSQDAITAAKGLTLVNALKSENPMAIAQAVQKMNATKDVIGKAGGGLASLPGLIKNDNKNTLTDKTAFDGLNGSLVAKMLNQQPPAIRAAVLKKITQAA